MQRAALFLAFACLAQPKGAYMRSETVVIYRRNWSQVSWSHVLLASHTFKNPFRSDWCGLTEVDRLHVTTGIQSATVAAVNGKIAIELSRKMSLKG